jgi:hypothetical protein
MGYSKTLNSLKTIIAVATAFNIAACLVTESAQAIGIGRFSGNASNASSFTFDLVDVQDQAPNDSSVGVFPGAIQNFNFQTDFPRSTITFCGKETCPGNVTVTKFTTDSNGNAPGIPGLTWTRGTTDFNFTAREISNRINFNNNVFRYDVTFDGVSTEPALVWFIESNDFNLIKDLSGLNQFQEIVGTYVGRFARGTGTYPFYISRGEILSQQVPEPSITHALLGLGVLGTVSLLKRNKRFLKSVTQNSSSLSLKST